jgi:glycosyltransferase involved in cell wall biosynthesis
MRVLHVIPSVSSVHGGPSEALRLMEQSLCAAGIEMTVLTTDDNGPASRFESGSYPAASAGAERIYCRKWLDFYLVAPAMLSWLRKHVRDFDVVHIHALFSFASVLAALMARRRGVPYVVRPLGTLTRYGITERRPLAKRLSLALLERRILERAAAVHFTSHAELEEAKLLNAPFKGVVIPLGLDLSAEPAVKDLRHDYPCLHNRVVLLYLSRLDPKKNIEGLLKAFSTLEPRRNGLALLIAGAGQPSYTACLKSLADSLGLDEEVIWLGHVEGDEKAAVFAAADLFVLPSLSENFGIAAVEALRAGLPCVLGRGVAIAAEVESSGAGVSVNQDAESIARGIDILIRDAKLRRSMGERGPKLAEKAYSQSAMTERLIGLYQTIAHETVAAS